MANLVLWYLAIIFSMEMDLGNCFQQEEESGVANDY